MPLDIRIRFGRPFAAFAKSRAYHKRKRQSVATSIGPTTAALSGVSGILLVNLERIAKGLKIGLGPLFEKV
jgi:hypothetical protein